MRVALVLIYPCGKAWNSPPEGVLKEGRRTYEMARAGPFFEGALAPARWPHELEKPNPDFGRSGLVGVFRVWCSWAGPGGAPSDSLQGFRLRWILFFAGLWYAVWHFVRRPFPALGKNPLLDLMDYHTPTFYGWVMLWYYAAPFVTVMLAGLFVMTIWKVWFESRGGEGFRHFRQAPKHGRFHRIKRLRKS